MAVEVKMPQLGESVTEGTIAKWLVKPGDKVNKYDPLCEVMTDKVNAEVPSTVSGVIKEILVPEGETVSVGTPICLMEAEGEGSAEDAAKDGAEAAPQAEAAQSPAPAGAPAEGASEGKPAVPAAALPRDQKRRYSPAVLKLAQEYGIDLSQVPGTGREGRVTRKDVLRFIEQGGAAAQAAQPASAAPATPTRAAAQPVAQPADQARQPASQAAPQPASAAPGVKTEPGDQVIPVTPVRRAIATRMVQSKHEAPHAWTMVEVDVTGLVKLREAVKAEFEKREGFKLTYLPFVIKAVVESLKEYPILNSVWAGDSIVLKKRINISIAVATEDALYVPVIKDADEKSIYGLAKAVHDLAQRTRAGKLTPDDMAGGTFTVNNTGSFGSILSMPIINYPQAAILSCEAIVKRPVVRDDGSIAVRDMMNLCLSLDHRILDGLVAGKFLQAVKKRLEAMGPGMSLY